MPTVTVNFKLEKMKLLSVNVSRPRIILQDGRPISTGIFKQAVKGRVLLKTLNLEGDRQADLNVHGGPDKAAYAYSFDHYESWSRELGRNDLKFGQFGENLTVSGLTEEKVHIGDIFRVGEALLEVTQPRVPCFKLGLKMGLPQFPKQFLHSGRSGFYLRVLEQGMVGAGDEISRVQVGPERLSIRELLGLFYFERDNLEMAQRASRIPALSHSWREELEERLKKG